MSNSLYAMTVREHGLIMMTVRGLQAMSIIRLTMMR